MSTTEHNLESIKPTSADELRQSLCSDAPDQEKCETFLERLQEAHNNIRPHTK